MAKIPSLLFSSHDSETHLGIDPRTLSIEIGGREGSAAMSSSSRFILAADAILRTSFHVEVPGVPRKPQPIFLYILFPFEYTTRLNETSPDAEDLFLIETFMNFWSYDGAPALKWSCYSVKCIDEYIIISKFIKVKLLFLLMISIQSNITQYEIWQDNFHSKIKALLH
jgi:hypothetical protein